MRTDNIIRLEALDALMSALGEVDTERFISMIKRDTFDYTEWRRGLWKDKSIEEIHAMSADYEKKQRNEYRT